MKNKLKRMQLFIRNYHKKGIIFGSAFSLTLLSLSILIPKISIHADPVDPEVIFEADARIIEPVAGDSPDMNIMATDEDKYSVSIASWYLHESPFPDLGTEDVFEEGKDYALRFVFTPKEGYTFRNDTIFTLNGKDTSCYGADTNREFIFYEISNAPEEPRFELSYDFNGGTKDGNATYSHQTVSFGIMLSVENLITELGVQVPEGKVLNYVTVNDEPFNIDDGYFIDNDTFIKYFWREDTEEMHNITFDPNGGTIVDDFAPSAVPAGQAFILHAPDAEQITPPEGQEFDAFEVNGERKEDGSLIIVDSDSSFRILWKNIEPVSISETSLGKAETTTEEVPSDTDLTAYINGKKADWLASAAGQSVSAEYRAAWEALYIAEGDTYKYPVFIHTVFVGVSMRETCESSDDVILVGDIDDFINNSSQSGYCTVYHYRDDYREVTVTKSDNPTDGSEPTNTTPQEKIYTILDGANQTISATKITDLIVRADGDISKLIGIKVDNAWADESNYEISSGSTIVSLKSSYLATLDTGEHTLTLAYDDGEVSTNFTILANTPETGAFTMQSSSALSNSAAAIVITISTIIIAIALYYRIVRG